MTSTQAKRPRTRRLTAIEKLIAIAPLYENRKPGHSLRQTVDRVAAQLGVGRSTIWNWYRRARSRGLAGLTPPIRSDKGRSSFIAKRPEIGMICARMSGDRCAFSIWKLLCLVFAGEAPSYGVVLRYVKGRYRAESNLQRAA